MQSKSQLRNELRQYQAEYRNALETLENPYLTPAEIQALDWTVLLVGEKIDLVELLLKP